MDLLQLLTAAKSLGDQNQAQQTMANQAQAIQSLAQELGVSQAKILHLQQQLDATRDTTALFVGIDLGLVVCVTIVFAFILFTLHRRIRAMEQAARP